MGQLIINVTSEQSKAVNAVVMDAQEWLQAAWNGKASSCMNRILLKKSNKNVSKLNDAEISNDINSLSLKTRKELNKEGKVELNI